MATQLYVMHYKPAVERKKSIQHQMNIVGVAGYIFVDGYDKEELSEEILNTVYAGNEQHWNVRADLLHDLYREYAYHKPYSKSWSEGVNYNVDLPWTQFRQMRMAEISLGIKHYQAWRDIEQNGYDYGIILEDDVIILPDFLENMNHNLSQTPADWDVICFGYGSFMRVPERERGKTVYPMTPPKIKCTDSYLISGRAAKLMADAVLPFSQPIDWEMLYWVNKLDLKVYWWDPPLTMQGSQVGMYETLVQT